jgi:hypothetical protein
LSGTIRTFFALRWGVIVLSDGLTRSEDSTCNAIARHFAAWR